MVESLCMNKASLAIIAALIVVFSAVVVAITLARGYQFDFSNKSLTATGILVATSDPDGAEVIINGKLKTATNSTINLSPGSYTVRIQKDGFSAWEKQIEIKKEEVFKTNAFLFPNLPDLRPLTFSGVTDPVLSPDGTKVAFSVASSSSRLAGNGIWTLDMGRPFGPISRQISKTVMTDFFWSGDSKQLVASGAAETYLLDTDVVNEQPATVTDRLPLMIDEWAGLKTQRQQAKLLKLPPGLADTLATSAGTLEFSPDETKVLYTATASATLLPVLATYLPGTDPTPQMRNLEPGKKYVYDLKEDRNYPVANCSWFPSSRHLLCVTENQISVVEYDGTNKAVVFNGPFDPKSVFVWPNWSKIVILTPLGGADNLKNLYTINLR